MENDKKMKQIAALVIAVCLIGLLFVVMQKSGMGQNNISKNNAEQKVHSNSPKSDNNTASSPQKVRPIENKDHVKGDVKAHVQIIVYSDFECPYCANFKDTLKQIEDYYQDKVVIAYRHFVLTSHPYAIPAANASECAAEQGKFWEMYEKLFDNSKQGLLNSEIYKKDARELNLDQAKFNECVSSETYKSKVVDQMVEGRNFGVNGTPTIFVNGEIVPGAFPFDDFTRANGDKGQGMRSIIDKYLK